MLTDIIIYSQSTLFALHVLHRVRGKEHVGPLLILDVIYTPIRIITLAS